MGKNRKKRGKRTRNAQLPGPVPQHSVHPAVPAPPLHKKCRPRHPSRRGGFRGTTSRQPMGPPGQRYIGPPHDFGPQPSRMRMMDNMAKHRQSVSVHNVPPPSKACPPQSQKKKDQLASKDTKIEPSKTMASKMAMNKNISANTPRGRSLGVITFIGNYGGIIEREDLKKFSFVFDAFIGKRSNLVPGVKVHFTILKNLGKECAVDVKVAPRGTDDIDNTVYEGFVTTALPDGMIMKKTDGTLNITTEKHNNLTASAADSLSEDQLNAMDEVELTVIPVDNTMKAVRLKKLPVGSVTFNQQANGNENNSGVKENTPGTALFKDKWKTVTSEAGSQELVVSYDVSSEKYEGTIVKIVPKNSQTQEMVTAKQEPTFGLLVTKVEGTEKCFSFKSDDVITKATMMVGDEVQFNISTNSVTKEECAVNLEILPDTFLMESEEQRKIGHVVKLGDNSGFVKTQQDPQLFFDMSEVMEETKLALFEKVEFTLVPNEAAGVGNRAVRIRRLNESIFSSAPKIEAFGVKEKKKMTIKLRKDSKDYIKKEVKAEDKSSESMDVVKLNKENDKALPSMTLKDLKKEREMKNEKTKPKGDLAQSSSRENSRRRYSRSRSKSRSRERSSSYYRSRDHTDIYRWSRSRSRERSGRSARKRSHSPDDGDDRYTKQSNIKEKIAQIPEYSVREELRKRRELMELKELIAHQKAMVSMEQNVKQIEPDIEVDIERGITTFDYQHVHRESMWMPDLKPTKSILKKQSELPDPQSQVSTCKETASFVKGESLNMQMGYRQRISAFDLNEPAYSKFESDSKKSLTTEGSEKIRLPEFKDSELVRKKKRLEELSESIGRKIAIIAMEQKPKSILKKRSELLSSQSETTSVDYCGQASQDDFVFTKLPSQSTAGALFDRSSNRQSVHSDTLGLFNRLLKESSATLHVTEPSHFNKPVVPQLVTQASNLWSLHDPKPSSMSKGCNSQDDQHWGSSRQTNEHPHSSNPSASQAALLDQKRTLTTQMERFLGALNKADSCIVNSLFHEARNDQALMSTQKHSQPQLDMNIPFMDELYDPFKEDEDNGHHPFIGRSVGKHSVREQTKSPVKTESHFYDPNKDDLLSNERAVQDGSRFSWLVGIKDLEPNKDTFRDEHKVEDDVLTNLKRIIMNFKSTKDTQESSSSSTTVSQFSYQPASTYVVSTAQPGSSQYAQISTSPALSTSQYSYHSNEQKFRGSTCPLDSSQNTNLQLSAYPYGTVPLPPNLGYASGQQVMAPHMMSSYSSYTTPMGNPYSACPPLTMPIPYGFPPISNPLLLSSMNSSYTTLHAGQNITDKKTQPVRSLKTIESKETVVTTVDVKGEPKGIPKNKVNNRPAKSLQKIAGIKLVSTTIKDDIMAKQKNERTRLRRIQRKRARRRLNYMKQAF